MAADNDCVEKNLSSEESMSESDSAEPVNPLYNLATSMSDHSSLGRGHTAAAGDQAANENSSAHRSATNTQPDDTASADQPDNLGETGVSSSGSLLSSTLPAISTLQISRPPQSSAASEEQLPATVKLEPPPAIPIRLVRAPSSAKPATNIPQVDCPEKIVSRHRKCAVLENPIGDFTF